MLAIKGGYAEIFKLLLSQPNIELNYENIWKFYFLCNLSFKIFNAEMIFSAIIGGCVEIFQILLSKTNFDINTVYISKEKLLMKFKKEF